MLGFNGKIKRGADMEARSISLHRLGDNKIQKLVVPFFQRHYIWEQENWEKLYNDFTTPEIKPFLGSIILKEVSTNDNVAEMNIIDGQQRLTTVSVLAKAIFDSLPEEVKKDHDCGIRRDVQGILFYRENAADNFSDSRIKIEPSKADEKAYTKIIRAEMFDEKINLDSIDEASSLIEQCYRFFRERLSGKTVKELTELYNNIFSDNKRVLVMITLQYGDINEQTIFDTINRAGVKLSVADIIKNNLFKACLDKAGDSEDRKKAVINEYEHVWEEAFYKSQENVKLWEQERILDDVNRNNLELLLYCVAQIHWGDEAHLSVNLERVYEEKIREYGYHELMEFITEICEYGVILKEFVLDFHLGIKEETILFRFKDHISRLFLILDRLDISVFYPYLLKRLKESKLDITDKELVDDFRILESFIIRSKISKKTSINYSKICSLLLKEGTEALIEKEIMIKGEGLTDEAIYSHLFSVSDDMAKILLFCIELYRCRDERKDIASLEYRYSLEHIMPEKWNRYWNEVAIIREGAVLDTKSELGICFRDARIQALGNKTLLTSKLNSSLQNQSFWDKIENKESRRPGYRSHTSLSITREIVEQFDKGDCIWDEEHIEYRTQQLFKEVIEIWPRFNEKIAEVKKKKEEESEIVIKSDPELEKFSEEELADPIKLISVVGEPSKQ